MSSNLLSSFIPINRKERFYTGTVLPMLICRNNFEYLIPFLSLVCKASIDTEILHCDSDVIFTTEFNIIESCFGNVHNSFTNFKESRETSASPDIVVIINNKSSVELFVIEAKMYNRTSQSKLTTQMNIQKESFIKPLESVIRSDFCADVNTHHAALLPKLMVEELLLQEDNFTIIHWEDILTKYVTFDDDYFYLCLKKAISCYSDKKSKKVARNRTKMQGKDIYSKHYDGTLEYHYVGVSGGLRGKIFEDLKSHEWANRSFEVSKEKIAHSNWLTVSDFLKAVCTV